jgi:hypothetical protein
LNCWNLLLMRSDMKGIFRSPWIVWFVRNILSLEVFLYCFSSHQNTQRLVSHI